MKTKLGLITALIAASICVLVAQSSNIQFRAVWDANPETDLAGYRVYLAPVASTTFTNAATVGVSASPSWIIPRAEWGKKIHVTAFNAAGLESTPTVTLLIPDVPRSPQNLQLIKETN